MACAGGTRGGRAALTGALTGVAFLAAGVAVAGTPITTGSEPLGTSHGLDYRRASSADAVMNGTAAAAAYCPDGKRLTGGGAAWSGATNEADLDDSAPLAFAGHGVREQWAGSGYNDAGASKTLSAYAICTARRGLNFRAKPIPEVPSGEVGRTNVKCPPDAAVTGGGVRTEETDYSRLLVTRPWDSADPGSRPDDGWQVRFFVNVATPEAAIAYAICSNSFDLAYRAGDGLELEAGETGTDVAICHPGEAVTGGGAAIGAPSGSASLNGARPSDGADGDDVYDDAFLANARVLAGAPRDFRSYAVCRG